MLWCFWKYAKLDSRTNLVQKCDKDEESSSNSFVCSNGTPQGKILFYPYLTSKYAVQIENKQGNIQHHKVNAVSLPTERSTNGRADKKQNGIVDTAERKHHADHIDKSGQVANLEFVGGGQFKELSHRSYLTFCGYYTTDYGKNQVDKLYKEIEIKNVEIVDFAEFCSLAFVKEQLKSQWSKCTKKIRPLCAGGGQHYLVFCSIVGE